MKWDEEEEDEEEGQGDKDRKDDEDDNMNDNGHDHHVQDHTGTLSSTGTWSHVGGSIATSSSPPHPWPAKHQQLTESIPLVERTPEEVDVTSSPSTSSGLLASDYEGLISCGLRQLFKNPKGQFKSEEQWDIIHHILSSSEDVVSMLWTSWGKSVVWQITMKLHPDIMAIIVIPFIFPLEEQLQSNLDKGIPSCKWTSTNNIPSGNQHIFCQLEHYVMPHFQA